MVDIIAVPGGNNSPDSSNKSSAKSLTDAEKFRELMQVKESQEKQKKKKKQAAEEDAEKKADRTAAQGTARKKAENPARLILPKGPKIEKVGESEKKQQQHKKRSEEIDPLIPTEESAEVLPTAKIDSSEILEETSNLVETATPPPVPPQPSASFEEEKKTESEESPEKEMQISAEKHAKPQEKKETHKPLEQAAFTAPEPTAPSFLSSPSVAAPGYSLLSPEVLALFEKLASVILVMQNSGKTEMTVTLNPQEFPSFKGASIVIEAYASAPGEFNIRLQGEPQAVSLFNANLAKLNSAFQNGKYGFRVRRLEAELDNTTSRIERKKSITDEQEGES